MVLDQYNSAVTIQRLSGKLKIRELTWSAPSKTEAFSKTRELVNAGNLELYLHAKAIQQVTSSQRQNGVPFMARASEDRSSHFPASRGFPGNQPPQAASRSVRPLQDLSALRLWPQPHRGLLYIHTHHNDAP